MNRLRKIGQFIKADHRYVLLGTSVIAAIGLFFAMQPHPATSFLNKVYTLEVVMYWFLIAWLGISAIALIVKLTHWKNYAEVSPFTKPPVARVLRYVSYAVVATALVFVVDRVVCGVQSTVQAALASDTNPTDTLASIFYMLDKSGDIFGIGIATTVQLATFGTIIAFFLAILLVFLRIQTPDRSDNDFVRFLKKAGSGFAKVYSTVVRGTPMMVQAMLIYFAGFGVLRGTGMTVSEIGAIWSTFVAGLVTISLNSTAYMMEVLRGGIEAVDAGQTEAARSLGLSQWQAMIKVVFPQGIKNAIPALSNELVVNIKDSSVLSVIGVVDLMFETKTVAGIYFKNLECYIIAAVCYLILTMIASWLLTRLSRRLTGENKVTPMMSTSDMTATVGTVASTSSSEMSLDAKKATS